MATYKGQDISTPDFVDQLLRLYGNRALEQPNVEEDLGAWPEATPDVPRRPGQKHYMDEQLMAHPINGLAETLRELKLHEEVDQQLRDWEERRSAPFNRYKFETDDKIDEFKPKGAQDRDVLPPREPDDAPPPPVQMAQNGPINALARQPRRLPPLPFNGLAS